MKKITAVLVLILISSALFAAAGISVRLGGAFSLVAAKNPHSAINKPADVEGNYLADYDLTMVNSAGFGFDTGLVFNLSSDYNMYLDFSMTYPGQVSVGDYVETRSDVKNEYDFFKESLEFEEFTSVYGSPLLRTLEVHVGFTRKIDLGDSPFNLNIGGGFGYRRIKEGVRLTMRKGTDFYCFDCFQTIAHISLDLHADVSYMISKNFALCATVMPGLSFYSSSKFYVTTSDMGYLSPVKSSVYYGDGESSGMKPRYENSGFAAGFTLATRLGVSYSF